MKTKTKKFAKIKGRLIEFSTIRDNGEIIGFTAKIDGKTLNAKTVKEVKEPTAQEIIDSV